MQSTSQSARATLIALAARLVNGGGFTVRRDRREHVGGGFVTSCHKPSEIVVRLSDLALVRKGGKPVDAGDFAFESLEEAIGWWLRWTAKAPAAATHVGGWIAKHDGEPCLYLDRTRVCETRDEAIAIARRLREKAIFDLNAGVEIEVAA